MVMLKQNRQSILAAKGDQADLSSLCTHYVICLLYCFDQLPDTLSHHSGNITT
jgi:hypothetical protein